MRAPGLRAAEQIALPSGLACYQIGRRPLYGWAALVTNGDLYGLVAKACDPSEPHSPLSAAMEDGPEWAGLVALGGMLLVGTD